MCPKKKNFSHTSMPNTCFDSTKVIALLVHKYFLPWSPDENNSRNVPTNSICGTLACRLPPYCIRQHTSAYVSIRQHTSLPIHQQAAFLHTSYVSIRQHTLAHVSIRQHTSAYLSIPQHTSTSAYVSIRQHTSAYVSIRQHTSAYVSIRQLVSIRQHTSLPIH
jgi:hypothetical protein